MTAVIPINQPQGNYTFVIFTNQDRSIFESNFSNNQAYQYITVYKPAPVDLIVNNIKIPDTVALGYSANIKWSLFNNSNNPAKGFETDGIYLSKDSTTNTTNDILIGTKLHQLDILPLQSAVDSSGLIISGITEGYYFVKVKTDILNNIIETNKQNNTGISTRKVYATIKVLPFNIITPDIFTSNFLYYKFIVCSK